MGRKQGAANNPVHDGSGNATASDVGHIYPFGSTEEPLRYATLGTRQRGHEGGPPFDAATGRGYVARHKGQYDDALKKNNQVIVAVVESFGGIASGGARLLRACSVSFPGAPRTRSGAATRHQVLQVPPGELPLPPPRRDQR